MQQLRSALQMAGVTQAGLATHLGLARSTVNAMCNGRYPVGREAELKNQIHVFLAGHGVDVDLEPQEKVQEEDEDEVKIRRNEMLTATAKKQFGLYKDPFTDDVHEASDVYLTDSGRFVAEYMFTTAKVSGMLAVIGESGSGKSTLRKLLQDRIAASGEKIKVIFPRTVDKSRLTVSAICDAVIQDVSDQKIRKSAEAKSRQMERVLTESSRAGWSHVLLIEEAHDLSIATLKYLKRFWELEDGFKRLLGIILVAQPELKPMLDESRNYDAREVIRRIEVAELDPFVEPEELKEYLDLKLRKAGSSADRCFSEDAYAAILDRMSRKTKSGAVLRFCYPLSVNNLVKSAMNKAASICEPKVTAELIKLAE